MNLKEAAKILRKYPQQTRDRPNTCYGGNGDVYECSCCGYALNFGSYGASSPHKAGCELEEANNLIDKQ